MNNRAIRIFVVVCLAILYRAETSLAQSAGSYTTVLSANTLTELRTAGRAFQATSENSPYATAVSFSLKTRNGLRPFSLIPLKIRGEGFRAEFDDGKTRSEDRSEFMAFREIGAKPGEFTRVSLYRSMKTGEQIIEGLSRVDGEYYHFSNKPGTTLTIEAGIVDAAAIENLHASCGTSHELGHAAVSGVGNSNFFASSSGNHIHSTLGSSGEHAESGEPPTLYSEFPTIQVATDADYEFFQIHGNDTNSRIQSILVQVGGIYRVQLGLDVEVVFQHVNTSSADPYSNQTNADLFFSEFRSHWNNNFSHVQRDVAHLFTGRTFQSNVAGIASLSAVCSQTRGYGISANIFSITTAAILAAHEIGHNLGSGHDTCPINGQFFVMCPVLNGSTAFSTGSKSAIASYVANSGSCITPTSGSPTNNPPAFGSIPSQSVSEGSTRNFNIPVTDPDGDTITLTHSTLEGFSIFGTTATYSPGFSAVTGGLTSQNKVVQITATDSRGAVTTVSVTIAVQNTNRPPSLTSPGNQSIGEGVPLSFTLAASDPDNETLRFSANSLPYGAYLNRNTGSFRWTPRWNQSGTHSITFQAIDPFGASASVSININVANTLSSPPPESLLVPTVYRPAGGLWYIGSGIGNQHGLIFDVPLAGNYFGDGILRPLVWRPESGMWYAQAANGSLEVEQFGLFGDLPNIGDVDGDGVDDPMVYRPTLGRWFVRLSSTQTTAQYVVGQVGDIPVVCDFDGDGKTDPGVYRPQTGAWYVYNTSSGLVTGATFGRPLDIPLPGRYGPQSNCNLAVWEPDTGNFNIAGVGRTQHGLPGDIPTPFDTNGDGRIELAVYRIQEGNWYILRNGETLDTVQLGLNTDYPVFSAPLFYALRHAGEQNPAALVSPTSVPLFDSQSKTLYQLSALGSNWSGFDASAASYVFRTDRDGDGVLDTGSFFRGIWTIVRATGAVETVPWGQAGDIPLSGDFDGDGKGDITVYRQGSWFTISSLLNGGVRVFSWGLPGDTPVDHVDYDGDGVDDPTIFRNGVWYIQGGRGGGTWTVHWGLTGDIPLAADFDRDGRSDLAVYRAGGWFVNHSSGIQSYYQWGLFGDSPTITNYFGDGAALSVYRPSNRTLYSLSLNGAGFRIQTPTLRPAVRRNGRTPPIALQLVDRASPVPVF